LFRDLFAEHVRALAAYVALSALSIHMRTEPGPLARAITFGAFSALKQKTEINCRYKYSAPERR